MINERLQRQIDRLLDEAEHSIGQKDWVGVIERVEHVLTLDPDNSDAIADFREIRRQPALERALRHKGPLGA